MKKRVLFICSRNSGRSQMAEAILRKKYEDHYEVFSAGLNPAEAVNPVIIRVMEEVGADMTHHRPKHVSEFHDMHIDVVVLLCECEGSCYPLPKATHIYNKEFPDPLSFTGNSGEILHKFRILRDEIEEWIDSEFGNDPGIS